MRSKNITILILSILVLTLGIGLYLTMNSIKDNNKKQNGGMKEIVLNSLKERRSIKKYSTMQIKDDDLKAILEAGTYAPSGMNKQSALMVVIQNPDTIMKIAKMNAGVMGDIDENNFKNPFYGAPTLVIVFADSTIHTYKEDGSLVMGNLLNAAHAVGLGSCWIHRAYEVFQTEEGRAMMERWGVDDKYVGIANCILGYLDGDYPETRPRKENYIRFVE